MRTNRPIAALLAMVMLCSLAACSKGGGDPEDWDEQYDLGMRYLEEGDYEEAVIAFTAAIDIDPDRAEAYVGRGQAYQAQGGKSDLRRAASDFEEALDLDQELEEAWIGLTEVRLAQGDNEAAEKAAREGLDVLDDSPELEDLLEEAQGGDDGDEGEPQDPAPGGNEPGPTFERPDVPAHEHVWMDANYQSPSVCSQCGAVLGEPLTPGFVIHDLPTISCANNVGASFSYTTTCYENSSYKTTAALTVTDYSKLSSDSTHEYREGYEWRVLTLTLIFSDENANNYGYSPGQCYEDYYAIELNDDTGYNEEDGDNIHYVNWYGDLRDVLIRTEVPTNEWGGNSYATLVLVISAQVPEGYDGVVCGLQDSEVVYGEGQYIYDVYNDSFRLFRFD